MWANSLCCAAWKAVQSKARITHAQRSKRDASAQNRKNLNENSISRSLVNFLRLPRFVLHPHKERELHRRFNAERRQHLIETTRLEWIVEKREALAHPE